MTKSIKEHESEYIHIKKETLENIAFYLFLIILITGVICGGYIIGKSNGYDDGFKDGNEHQWNLTVNSINKYGKVNMINKDLTLNMTIEKYHSCYDTNMFKINPIFTNLGRICYSNGTGCIDKND